VAATVLAVAAATIPVSAASERFTPPKRYYLSLGDSLAFGYQRDKLAIE
jgi:hypothetical protein